MNEHLSMLFFFVGPVVYRGDLIGCRAEFDETEDGEIPIFFSLNGQVVAKIPIKMGSDKSDIFPFVGMKNKGIRVLAKVCMNRYPLVTSSVLYVESLE